MESTRRRRSGGLPRIITAVFAVAFVVSIISTISALAAANLFKIENAELSELSTTAEGNISNFDETNIASSVTFHKLGDFAKYTITLKNTDSNEHFIESITDDNINPYISYEYDQHMGEQIDAGSDFVFVVTAKYSAAITNIDQRAQVSNVKFFIHFTDLEEEILIVPDTGTNSNTGDHIHSSVISLVISAVGLIIIGIIALKKHKKASKFIAAGIITVAAIATTATVKAATVEINSFTINTSYVLKDKLVVTYTDKDGNNQELVVNYGDPANIPDQSKDGYTLTGWEDENGNPVDLTQPITEDIKIHPVYRAHTYTIKFNGNGANGEMTNLAMTYDETKTLPANAFDFPGRTYAGWDTEANGSGIHYDDQAEVKNLTAEDNGIVTLYAQWSINPFHIDYDGNGATSGEMATTNCEYDQACELRDNAFEKTGYHFIGWKYNNTDYADKADVKNIIESGTITMVAQWEVNHYTIVFDINTDDANATGNMADMANLEYDRDYALTANAFTRTGYNFGGWNTEIDGRNFGLTDEQEFHNLTTTDNAVITLYAQWDPIHYTIAFHQNSDGVTGNMSSQVFAYDEAKNLTQNAFIKNHYKFMGWTTAANGTGTKYDDQASIFNLTTEDGATIDLYAQWKERTAYLKGTVNNSWGSAGDMIRSLPGYANATAFSHYEGEPNFDEIGTKYNMAISSSNFPVYTWIDGETIYWWSEAETIYAHEDSRNFFSGLKKAETIDYSGFNFSLTKNLTGFFRNTAALSTIDLSPLAAANPTTLEEMFYGSGIASVDLSPLNTTQTINMKGMFDSTTALETVNLSAIDTTNVTDMSYLFNNSANLKSVDFSHNNLSSVENMSYMFRSDKKLESLNFTGVNTPNLKKMSWMFGGAKIASLDLSDLDTENVTHFDELFYYADVANLDISGFDTHNATTFGSMFTGFNAHGQVLDLSHFDTTSLSGSMYEMFNGTNASVIDLSSFDISAERAANIGMANILHISNSVETIYATEKLHLHDYSSVPDTNLGVPADYGAQSKLVGGAGTPLRQLTLLGLSEYDKARIDDPCNGKPGMFAVKNAQYICYNANIPSGETGAGAQAGEYLTVGTGNLMANGFVRDGYKLMGWATRADGEKVYDDGAEITIAAESKEPLNLYAVWAEKTSDIDTGLNTKFSGVNPDATELKKYSGTPDFASINNEVVVSTDNSNFPTYIWSEGDTIYYWSEADKIFLNQDSYGAFGYSKFVKLDLSGLYFDKIVSMNRFFRGSDKLEEIIFPESMNTSNITTFEAAFYGCNSLKSIDLSSFANSSVTDIREMFYNNTGLKELNMSGWDLSNIENRSFWAPTNVETINFSNVVTHEDMSDFFKGLTKLTSINLSNVNTSNTTNMRGMFSGDASLQSINVGSFNTSNVSNMGGMFSGCSSLSSIDVSGFDVENVETFSSMFDGTAIGTLDLSNWETTDKLTNMYSMFGHNAALSTLKLGPNFNTSKVTTMNRLFVFDTSLVEVDLSVFDTSSLQDAESMFHGATNLKTIYVSDSFKNSNISNPAHMFNSTSSLRGGAGTAWNSAMASNKDYARIDDPDNGEPGYFTMKGARYIRYNGNGADNATPYGTMTSEYLKAGDSLKKNAFTRSGYEFAGWKDADGNDYTDEQVMADLAESKTPLELYAQWDAKSYAVTFNANGGEMLQSAKTVTYLQPYGELPTPVRYDYTDSMLGGKYGFKEWNTKADGTGDAITSSSVYTNTDNTTLYAIWNNRFTVTIYNGESETPTIANYGIDSVVDLQAQNVAGKQFLYWEVDGAKKSYSKDYGMRMFYGKDLTIRAIYGSESDLESQQPGTYISDIYRQYSGNKIVARSYSYVPDGYEIVKAGVIATLDANIANGTFDDQTATYPRAQSVNGSSDNYYFTWTKSNVTSADTVYVKAYLIYKDADGVEHTTYGDLVTATLTE